MIGLHSLSSRGFLYISSHYKHVTAIKTLLYQSIAAHLSCSFSFSCFASHKIESVLCRDKSTHNMGLIVRFFTPYRIVPRSFSERESLSDHEYPT